jgi:branched-chain amino acid transport system substrate-binding protein
LTRIIFAFLIVGLFLVGSAFGQGPIKLGFIGPMTGGSAVLGQRLSEGFKMYWDEVNEKGGFKGRKIQLIIDDDEAQPAKALSAAKKQILRDKIVCAFATCNSPVTMAVVPIFQKHEVPHVTQVFAPKVTKMGSKYVFRVSPTIIAYVDTIYDWSVKKIDLKTVAIFSDTGGYGKDVGDAWEKGAPKYGVKVVTREKCDLKDKDFTGQLLRVKKLNPQALVLAMGWETTMGLVVKNMKKLGMPQQILTGALDVDKFVEYGKEATDGVILGLPIVGFEKPRKRAKFAERFRAKYGKDPVIHNVWGYDAANIVAIGLKKAHPDITRENIYKGIASISKAKLIQGVYDFKTSQDGIRRSKVAKIMGGKAKLIKK